MIDARKIGKVIAAKRKVLGMTQKELADKLCLSDKTVSKWETGRGLPNPEAFARMCHILNIDPKTLL